MISIIIPTYNRSHLVARAIGSVLAQTNTDWELIVVDDGSKDNTHEVIQPFLTDQRIKYIKKENTGAADTRNVGVSNSSREWITFLDSDDEVKADWLARFVEEIRKGAEIISCGLEKYDESGKLIETRMPRQNQSSTGGQFTNGGVYVIRRKLFDEIGGFDAKLRSGQHTELHFRIKAYALQHGITSTLIPEALVKIHIHSGYRIRSDHKAKLEGSLYTYHKHYHGALRSKKMRSLYEGIIAYNAFNMNDYQLARQYALKSFLNKPTWTNLQRLLRYFFRK